MKKLLLLGLYWLVTVSALAFNTPEKINYQGVARSADGALLVNQQLGIQIQIRTVDSNGDVVYSEVHTVITNQYGLFNLQIGDGSIESGVFTDVDWSASTFVELSIDFEGGTDYVSMGTSQLVSVPYALHSKTADNVFSGNFNDLINAPANVSDFANDAGYITSADNTDSDATNEIQDLSLIGSTLKITNNASATEINLAPFSGTNTDEQTLSLTGTNLFISNGNAVSLASIQDGYEANTDAQTLSVTGTDLSIAGGNTVDISTVQDGFEANTDSQTLSLSGDNLSITGGNMVTLPSGGAFSTIANVTSNTQGAQNTDNFVFGSPQLDDDGDVNHDSRIIFKKNKSAFRAGRVTGDEWDDINMGNWSAAFGYNSIASGHYTIAAGALSIASGDYSTALGNTTEAAGFSSTAMGRQTVAIGNYSTALGYTSIANSYNSVVIGQHNLLEGTSSSWVLSEPLFVVGNGTASNARNNAITVLKNGNMGIGVADPDSELEIAGQIKITEGSPGNGKVLTSDANGLASWVTPAGGGGTDDQKIDELSLMGSHLQISLEGDAEATKVLDLSGLADGYEPNTDSQIADVFSLTGSTLNLSLSGDGQATNTVDLSSLGGGGGTDDQKIDIAILNGTNLELSLEGDGEATKIVNLSSLQDGFEPNTDTQLNEVQVDAFVANNGFLIAEIDGSLTNELQTLSLSGTDLTISSENTVDLSALQDGTGTDTQGADIFSFDGSTLSLSLDNDGEATNTVDLSSLGGGGGTDDQKIDIAILNGTNLELSLEGDGEATKIVNLSSLQDGFEPNTDTQLNEVQVDAFVANNGYLTSEVDGSTTNELQTLALSGTDLSISSENTVDLSALQDGTGTDTQGADIFSFDGSTLSLSLDNDGEATNTVDLSSLGGGGGTDDQKIDIATLNGTNLELSLESDGEATKIIDLSSLQDGVGTFSNVGIITSNSNGNTQTDDFVFGSPSLDYSGNTNHRNRFFFDKSKAAFRAGLTANTGWDVANIGNYSIALGYNPVASGENSFAAGYYSTATATGAIAIGYNATASDSYATALGFETDATWAHATAFGKGTLASRYATTAFGFETVASSSYATASGYQSVASGQFSTASGRGTAAQSHSSVAVGSYNTLLGGNAANWVASDPIFIIGNGTSNVARSTAVTVLKNGNVGIGFPNPTADLQVNGTVSISRLMHLTPQGVAPSGVMGDLYVRSDGKLFFHNGTAWKEVSLL